MKSSDENSDRFSVKSDFRKKKKRKVETVNKSAGRPNCLDREKLSRLLEAYYTYPYSYRELADMFGVSRMTVWRAVQAPVAISEGVFR